MDRAFVWVLCIIAGLFSKVITENARLDKNPSYANNKHEDLSHDNQHDNAQELILSSGETLVPIGTLNSDYQNSPTNQYHSALRTGAQAQSLAVAQEYGSSQSQAQAQAQSLGLNSLSLSQAQTNVLGGQSHAEAQSHAQSYGNLQNYGLGDAISGENMNLHPNLRPGGFNLAPSNALALSGNLGQSQAKAYANSRVIPENELLLPQMLPELNEGVQCSKYGELHYLWANNVCYICVCLQDSYVCVSCNGCRAGPPPYPTPNPYYPPSPVPPFPIPPSPVPPSPFSPTPSPTPVPYTEVSCNPLPSNRPFQNPLNPCQVCVCKEIMDPLGKLDVNIDCQENPQCVLPPEPVPTPDPHNPVPLPLCNKLPLEVPFPHPTDSCLLCKCIAVASLVPVKHLSCARNPQCDTPPPTPFPVGPHPPQPIPEPSPPPPPLPPSPLPGPPPHESCRPYAPNQPFEHPWDECQMCVCTEARGRNLVEIEVNCFTKASCCVEPPVSPGLNQPSLPPSFSEANANAQASSSAGQLPYNLVANSQAQALSRPTQLLVGENFGLNQNYPNSLGYLPNYPGSYDQGLAPATADANGQVGYWLRQPSSLQPGVAALSPGATLTPGGLLNLKQNLGQANALAQADANNQMKYLYNQPGSSALPTVLSSLHPLPSRSNLLQSGVQTGLGQMSIPGLGGSNQMNYWFGQPGSNSLYNTPGLSNLNLPGNLQLEPNNQALASAQANVLYNQGGLANSFSQAEAQAYSQASSGYGPHKTGYGDDFGHAQGVATADAVAGNYPYESTSNLAQAEANANAVSHGILPQNSYDNLYKLPGLDSVGSQASSQANAYGNDAQGSAFSSIKSADPALQENRDDVSKE